MHHHFILHKPYGYLSQFVCPLKKKKLLGELHHFPAGTMAIGRLDEDSEGLLLLTTDGAVSYAICSHDTEKEYYAQVDGIINDEAIDALQKGVEISYNGEKYLTKPSKAFKVEELPNFPERIKRIRNERHGPTSWVSISVKEGKFRQIRKMTAVLGFPTLRLVRVRIGNIHLGDMPSGTCKEVDNLRYS